jgi:hypothetical protein
VEFCEDIAPEPDLWDFCGDTVFLMMSQMLHRAWVGDRRAARMAGRSPARAPMMMAAVRPPAQASVGMMTASAWARA